MDHLSKIVADMASSRGVDAQPDVIARAEQIQQSVKLGKEALVKQTKTTELQEYAVNVAKLGEPLTQQLLERLLAAGFRANPNPTVGSPQDLTISIGRDVPPTVVGPVIKILDSCDLRGP